MDRHRLCLGFTGGKKSWSFEFVGKSLPWPWVAAQHTHDTHREAWSLTAGLVMLYYLPRRQDI